MTRLWRNARATRDPTLDLKRALVMDTLSKRRRLLATRIAATMHHAAEVQDDQDAIIYMTRSLWRLNGEIRFNDDGKGWRIAKSGLWDGGRQISHFAVVERFLRRTIVDLLDCESGRSFQLRQRWIWSGHLEMFEGDSVVARFDSKPLAWEYEVQADAGVPESTVLLAIWLAMVGLVFSA